MKGIEFKVELDPKNVDPESVKAMLKEKLGDNFRSEIEMNRAWIYDDDEENVIVGETNFVVPEEWAIGVFEEVYQKTNQYVDFDDFLDGYEPEDVGEYMYQRAKAEGVLIEDIGKVLYEL